MNSLFRWHCLDKMYKTKKWLNFLRQWSLCLLIVDHLNIDHKRRRSKWIESKKSLVDPNCSFYLKNRINQTVIDWDYFPMVNSRNDRSFSCVTRKICSDDRRCVQRERMNFDKSREVSPVEWSITWLKRKKISTPLIHHV